VFAPEPGYDATRKAMIVVKSLLIIYGVVTLVTATSCCSTPSEFLKHDTVCEQIAALEREMIADNNPLTLQQFDEKYTDCSWNAKADDRNSAINEWREATGCDCELFSVWPSNPARRHPIAVFVDSLDANEFFECVRKAYECSK